MGRWLYVLYWSECLFRGTFSLWLLTYLHCVYLALWTRKVFVWKFYAPYKNIKIKNKNSLTPLFEATPWHQYNKRQLTRKPRTALGTGTTISPARETIVKYQSPMISVDGAKLSGLSAVLNRINRRRCQYLIPPLTSALHTAGVQWMLLWTLVCWDTPQGIPDRLLISPVTLWRRACGMHTNRLSSGSTRCLV